MSSVLESVEWGKPALSLLSQCKELDPNLPAVMHLRHSERTRIRSREERGATLTETGKKAAYEYGENLPRERKYRIFHTPVKRTIETAEKIQEGLQAQIARSQLKGVFFTSHHNQERLWDYLIREAETRRETQRLTFLLNWVSGHYPPWEVEPGITLAQRVASVMMQNLESADSECIDVYVSHDNILAALLFYWVGIMPTTVSDRISYLDGFMLQLTDERIRVSSKFGTEEAYYPYWWNF